eukprot:10668201-Alexandrium_andersonii.AAC.1
MAAEVEAFLSRLARSGGAEDPPTGASGPVAGPPISAPGTPVPTAGASQWTHVRAGGGLSA